MSEEQPKEEAEEIGEGGRSQIHEPPGARLKKLENNENFKRYLEQRRIAGFERQRERTFKNLCGIKTHIEVDEHLRKLMELKPQEYRQDVRFAGDDEYDVEEEDAGSYSSEMFINSGDVSYLQHLLKLKSVLKNELDPLWYYSDSTKYIIKPCGAEQCLPIIMTNLKRALSKFEHLKRGLVFCLRMYKRPGFLQRLRVPPGFQPSGKRKARPVVRTAKNRRTGKTRQGKARGKTRLVPQFKAGEPNDELLEWNRNSTIMDKLAAPSCIPRKQVLLKYKTVNGIPVVGNPPYKKAGPPDINAPFTDVEKPRPFDWDPEVLDEAFNWEDLEVEDEEEIEEDEADEKKKPRTSNLLKAIFEECLDEMKERGEESGED